MSQMRLPSLAGLVAFEAAVRNAGITKAATELNLTQTAVSHRIRTLEKTIGKDLFHRRGHILELTDEGRLYFETVQKSLLEISAATARAAGTSDQNVLTVHCLGTFAIKRLLPLLPDFRSRYPGIEIRLRTIASVPTDQTGFDVAIWHGTGRWPGLDAWTLGEEEVFPVCSPRLVDAGPPLAVPGDIVGHTLIKSPSTSATDEWPLWMQAAGVHDSGIAVLVCDHVMMATQAAIDGLGIMLGRTRLVKSDLEAGRLVEPFGIRARSQYGYYLVSGTEMARSAKVRIFRDWLLEALM